MTRPYQASLRHWASPVWIPMRTRSGSGVGHASAAMDDWMFLAAAMAWAGCVNTENVESPSPWLDTSSPPAALTSCFTMSSCRAVARDMAASSRSHRATEPTMSVRRNEPGYQPSRAARPSPGTVERRVLGGDRPLERSELWARFHAHVCQHVPRSLVRRAAPRSACPTGTGRA